MIVVDTSALMAILLGEDHAEACAEALASESDVLISAATFSEALIVAGRRNVRAEMMGLVRGLGFQVVSVTAQDAIRVSEAYERWGKGVHPAGLNYGDCFAYVLAQAQGCPLLFVGEDFARTDVRRR